MAVAEEVVVEVPRYDPDLLLPYVPWNHLPMAKAMARIHLPHLADHRRLLHRHHRRELASMPARLVSSSSLSQKSSAKVRWGVAR